MTSQKQIEANRHNALNSTGPKTAEGKNASRKNAFKHGLTAETVVVSGEDADMFEAMRQDIVEELAPETALQFQLADRLAGILWRLRRIPQIEASLLEAHRLDAEYEQACSSVSQLETERRSIRSTLYDTYQGNQYAKMAGVAVPDMTDLDKDYTSEREKLEAARQRRMLPAAMLGRAFRKSLADMDTISQLSRYERELIRLYDATLTQFDRSKTMQAHRRKDKILDLTAEEGSA